MPVLTLLSQGVCATSHLIGRLVAHLCVGIIYIMLGLLVSQVLMRYFLGAPPSWTEELAIILFAWLVLLYATVGVSEKFHVVIETIPADWTLIRSLSDRVVAVFVFGFGLVALTSGINYVQRTSGQKSAALQIPIEVMYLCVPVCGALLMLHATALILDPHRAQGNGTKVQP